MASPSVLVPPTVFPTGFPTASDPEAADSGEIEDASTSGHWPAVVSLGDAPWQIQRPSTVDHPMEAFTDAPSYLPGDTVRLAVNTDAASFTVDFFRIGPTITAVGTSAPQQGLRQPAAEIDPATKMVRAKWLYSYSQPIPLDWKSGLYLAKLDGAGGSQGFVPFVVRSTRPSRFLFVTNVLNDQAYNAWGGSSLYETRVGEPVPGVRRAFAVSLDRPFIQDHGAGQIMTMAAPVIGWLERQGYDVTYTTDYDLSIRPEQQPLPAAVLFNGHGEYWGAGLRDWLDEHVLRRGDLGLGVFAADTGYWQVRFADDSLSGPRTVIVYKRATLDPTAASRCPGGLSSGAEAFRRWPCGRRESANRPEQALFGVQYGSIVPTFCPYRLAASSPAWLLSGTGLIPGDSLGELAGGEVDSADPEFSLPTDVQIIATASCTTLAGATAPVEAALRRTPSGGRVFASGTFWWAWGLEPAFAAAHGVPAGFERLNENILAFLAGV